MSIAGGYYKAIERAEAAGCDCVQVFMTAPRRWPAVPPRPRKGVTRRRPTSDAVENSISSPPIPKSDVQAFQSSLMASRVSHPISHASYLINLASPEKTLWRKSIDAFILELQRAAILGIPYVVLHPGSFMSTSEQRGLRRIITALNEIHCQTRGCRASCLLETTAGQGTSIGWRFEQLAALLEGVDDAFRLGICFDTCHVFAAGYRMGTEADYKSTMREFNKLVGVQRIKAFHLNDSEKPLGSRVDRHAHIGRGKMGLKPFRFLLNDRRFRRVPMYLETAKGVEDGIDLDVINLRRLRRLVSKK